MGPLTNVGLLFRIDPEIPRLLKRLVLMCGQFFGRSPGRGPVEWNAYCDPHAAAIVYGSAVAIHRSHGLDVTQQVRMPAKEVRARFQAPLLQTGGGTSPKSSSNVGTKSRFTIHLPPPRSLTTAFAHSRAETCRLNWRARGWRAYMHWQADGEASSHQVADTVDPDRFFAHYFSVFS